MMETIIYPQTLRRRQPYYLRCAGCGRVEESSNKAELALRLTREGWRYDTEKDGDFCPACLKEVRDDD